MRGKRSTVPLTQAMLKKHCIYDPISGFFTAKHRSVSGKHQRGDRLITSAGRKGYQVACLCGNHFYLHRLAWMYIHEYMPKKPLKIIHIDGNKKNNAIKNLKTELPKNYSPVKTIYRNTDGNGVKFSKLRSKWTADIKIDGRTTYLGHFATEKEAIKARKQAEQDLDYYRVA